MKKKKWAKSTLAWRQIRDVEVAKAPYYASAHDMGLDAQWSALSNPDEVGSDILTQLDEIDRPSHWGGVV